MRLLLHVRPGTAPLAPLTALAAAAAVASAHAVPTLWRGLLTAAMAIAVFTLTARVERRRRVPA